MEINNLQNETTQMATAQEDISQEKISRKNIFQENSAQENTSQENPAKIDISQENTFQADDAWEIPLIRWYLQIRRDLPWRHTHDPYGVWISEIMLQQTRVDTVIDYYNRFMKLFPTVQALAKAPEEEVLKAWEGLGYYSRARNMQKAAKILAATSGVDATSDSGMDVIDVMDDSQVKTVLFPSDPEGWRKLPGIGAYTAGAICSIALNKPAAAVDGNVLRVVTRLYADRHDIAEEATRKRIEQVVLRHIPVPEDKNDYDHGPSAFTQSLMELGALVCQPKAKCEICPLRNRCQAYAMNLTEEIPVKTKAKEPTRLVIYTAIVKNAEGKVLMHKRAAKGLLGGLWEYPGIEAESISDFQEKMKTQWHLDATVGEQMLEYEHVFSHRIWQMKIFIIEKAQTLPIPGLSADVSASACANHSDRAMTDSIVPSAENQVTTDWRFADVQEQKAMMLPTAFRPIQNMLQNEYEYRNE